MPKINRAKEDLVSQQDLKDYFMWDDVSNVLRWLRPLGNRVSIGSVAGCINKLTGYRVIAINRVKYLAHRLVWLYHYGEWPSDQIDHIDGDPLNNHIDNLRVVTNQENLKNQKLYINNTSGVAGVYFHKQHQKWRAEIRLTAKTSI